MASRCKTCTDEILNSDFVKCYGPCSNAFHSKCVSISKTLLNALGANPNIRWYCHDCNMSNPIASSIVEMKDSIGHLSASLSSDFGQFLKSMSEMTKCVTTSLSSISSQSARGASITSSNARAVLPPAMRFLIFQTPLLLTQLLIKSHQRGVEVKLPL